MDLFVGVILERIVPHGLLGETATCLVAEQFRRTKLGDRFWFENGHMPNSFSQGEPRPAEDSAVQKSGNRSRLLLVITIDYYWTNYCLPISSDVHSAKAPDPPVQPGGDPVRQRRQPERDAAACFATSNRMVCKRLPMELI